MCVDYPILVGCKLKLLLVINAFIDKESCSLEIVIQKNNHQLFSNWPLSNDLIKFSSTNEQGKEKRKSFPSEVVFSCKILFTYTVTRFVFVKLVLPVRSIH